MVRVEYLTERAADESAATELGNRRQVATALGVAALRAVDFAGDRLLVSHADGSLDVRDVSGATLRRTIPGDPLYAMP